MKRLLILVSCVVLLLCACSPKLVNGSSSNSFPENHPDYAVVYLYRTGGYVKTAYDVHLNNDVVYRSKNKTKTAIKVDKPGKYQIWGKTESSETLTFDIEMGQDYYVKTFVHMGAAIWRPSLEIVSSTEGKKDWNSIK